MKCPKCEYLGFETGDRCRNCGYDFSLMAAPPAPMDLALHTGVEEGPVAWPEDLDTALADRDLPVLRSLSASFDAGRTAGAVATVTPVSVAAPAPAAAAASLASAATPGASSVTPVAAPAVEPIAALPPVCPEPALPLFAPGALGDDEPLIKVPAQPRAPLAVRKTPENPRLRSIPKAVERLPAEPELDFVAVAEASPRPAAAPGGAALASSGAGARLMAAAIDHAILFTIDAIVIYLTLRIAALPMSDWAQLAFLPMGAFLGLLKLAYFTAFTCVGGQTIGKMALGIRVVGEDQRVLDAPQAIHRALAGAVSFLTLGLGFVPVLFGSDHRALHDRLAHTRVVVLPGA